MHNYFSHILLFFSARLVCIVSFLIQNVQEAENKVEEKMDSPKSDHTLEIVLGTLGGLLGVVLLVGMGYHFYWRKVCIV